MVCEHHHRSYSSGDFLHRTIIIILVETTAVQDILYYIGRPDDNMRVLQYRYTSPVVLLANQKIVCEKKQLENHYTRKNRFYSNLYRIIIMYTFKYIIQTIESTISAPFKF